MEVRARASRLRVPPRKARLVAKEVKGKHASLAVAQLHYHPSKAALHLRKVLLSAIANAVENEKRDADSLVIARIDVDEGLRMKRIKTRAQGRANRIHKRTSHITVYLDDAAPFEIRKSGAKPKPRPKFDAPKKSKKKEEAAAPVEEAQAVVETPAEEVAAEAPATEEVAAPEEEKKDQE
ncbi:MAG TPA: 50S ribosomal protein L22 [Fimbriimonadales bacterium]|nr:50S ribosomal protein L22 [Fimbriimonadales bacterium]